MKAVPRGRLIALRAFIKKLGITHTSNSKAYLKSLKQKVTNTPKRSRCLEIVKIRAEINLKNENNANNQ
jgi:DNA-binding transcriptional regulator YiaG